MAAGADVIYQATFFDGTWRGHADFLLRVDDADAPVALGPVPLRGRRHEARPPRQGQRGPPDLLVRRPARPRSRASGPSGCTSRSAAAPGRSSASGSTTTWPTTGARAPVPGDDGRRDAADLPAGRHVSRTRSSTATSAAGRAECAARRRADDHLSLVAGISARQRRALTERGVPTLEALGDLAAADGARRSRARAPARSRASATRRGSSSRADASRAPRYELLLPEAGAADRPGTGPRYRSRRPRRATCSSTSRATRTPSTTASTTSSACSRWTARSTPSGRATPTASSRSTAEQRAFERLIDFFMERLDADPGDARLPLRAVRADRPQAADGPLRDARGRGRPTCSAGGDAGRPLRAVRQSLRASVESYSIKKMEAFYGFEREIDLRDAGSSIVAFEEWLELGEGERPGRDTPRPHRALQPRRRREQPAAPRLARDAARRAGGADRARRSRGRRRASSRLPAELTEAQAHDPGPRRPPRRPGGRADRPGRSGRPSSTRRWLLAQLLGWHRREDKATWWEFHRLMDLTPEELVDEADPIGLLEPVGAGRRAARGKQVWRYAFPTQEFDLGRLGGRLYEPRQKPERPERQTERLGGRRRRRRRPGGADHRHQARSPADAPSRGRRPARHASRRPSTRQRLCELGRVGRRARHRGRRSASRGPRPPDGPSTHAPARTSARALRRDGETDLARRPPARARARSRRSSRSRAHPAPARRTAARG